VRGGDSANRELIETDNSALVVRLIKRMAEVVQKRALVFLGGVAVIGVRPLVRQTHAFEQIVDAAVVLYAVSGKHERAHTRACPDVALKTMFRRAARQKNGLEVRYLLGGHAFGLPTHIRSGQAHKAQREIQLDVLPARLLALALRRLYDRPGIARGKGFDAPQADAQMFLLTTMIDPLVYRKVETRGEHLLP
jgi:hypothetical protein